MTMFEASFGGNAEASSLGAADAVLSMVEEEVVVRDEEGRVVGVINHEPLSIDCVF